MKPRKKRVQEEVNSSSMADIAFLLLIFFLVSTEMPNEKGLNFTLPKKQDKNEVEVVETKINKRNVFGVIVNSNNDVLAKEEPVKIEDLRAKAIAFITNEGKDENLSDDPSKAIITLRIDRGTKYQTYIEVQDALLGAYNKIWADYLGMSEQRFLALDDKNHEHVAMKSRARKAFPFLLSKMEPNDFGNY